MVLMMMMSDGFLDVLDVVLDVENLELFKWLMV